MSPSAYATVMSVFVLSVSKEPELSIPSSISPCSALAKGLPV